MKAWQRVLVILFTLAVALAGGLAYAYLTRGKILEEAQWDSPWWALGFIVVPIVLGWTTFGQDRRRPRLRVGTVAPLAKGPRGIRPYFRDVPGVLRASALAFLVAALCRPINIVAEEKSGDTGIDIMVVMDLSGSMRAVLDGNAADVPGAPKLKPGERLTRIDTAKAVVKDFIGRRKSDRIGVIVFGKQAYVLSPLTFDYHVLNSLVSKLDLTVVDNSGTAIGDGLMSATARLRKSEGQSKVIILLTDGDNNAGKVAPDKAAEIAKNANCKVFAIQIGNGDEVDVDEGPDVFGNPRYSRQRFPVNPELLKRITDKTGGKTYIATDTKDLVNSMHEVLDQFDKTRFEDAPRSSQEDLFPLLLLPGVALVGLEVLLRALLLRRFP